MAHSMGRMLNSEEVVHHLNGDKLDNRIDNLQLFSCNAKHLRFELSGKIPNWSDEGNLLSVKQLTHWLIVEGG